MYNPGESMENNSRQREITALQIQQRNKERVNVFLDGEFAFGLNLLAAMQLRKGQLLGPAEIAALQGEDDERRAYESALHYVGYRPRSAQEIERNLQEKEYAPEVIAATLQRLHDENILNDEEFARYWVENRTQFRPRGSQALRYELRQKGIDNATIAAAVENVDQDAAAWAALAPKLARFTGLEEREFAQKVSGLLARRGFSYEIVRRVIKRAWGDLHDAPMGDDNDFLISEE